ncbi:MAG TPA: SCO family protein [Terriglobales bacterium]|nr:SCO family protein [Terriglobales bacterium]
MSRQSTIRRLSLAVVIGLASPAFAQPPQAAPAQSGLPPLLEQVGIDQRLNETIPLDLAFRDEAGRSVTLGRYFGKRPVLLSLVYYTCPMLCGQVLSGTTSALGVLKLEPGRDFELISVSINPHETPADAARKKEEVLARYRRAGAAEGWHFLTGEQASIDALAKAVGFRYAYDAKTGQYAHGSAIMLLTPEGRIAQYRMGIEYSPKDLRLGLVEASRNKIGNLVDQVLLYCYHFDPTAGRYTAVAMNILRLAGAATVLALGTFIIVMLRRDAAHARMGASG